IGRIIAFLCASVSLVRAAPPITFSVPTHYNLGIVCDELCVADFNGDGHPDLAVTSASTGKINILLNRGDGTFTNSATLLSLGTPLAIASADFDGDQKMDIVVANYPGDSLTVWLGNGDGSFGPSQGSGVTVNSSWASLTVGDFNSDGIPD